MPPLTRPKPVTMWTHALLFNGEWFKVVKRWQSGGAYRCCFWVGVLVLASSTLETLGSQPILSKICPEHC